MNSEDENLLKQMLSEGVPADVVFDLVEEAKYCKRERALEASIKAPKLGSKVIEVMAQNRNEYCEALARILISPEMTSAQVIQGLEPDSLNINLLARELKAQVTKIVSGDMGRAEELLISQAHTLNSLFTKLASRSWANIADSKLDIGERYMRLALKAQSQCARTLQILAEVKNPIHLYAKQVNLNQANNQQINHNARAEKLKPAKRSIQNASMD